MTKQAIVLVGMGLAVSLTGSVFLVNRHFYGDEPVTDEQEASELAQCLAQSEAVLYCAPASSDCRAQASAFGVSFRYLRYIDCSENGRLCAERGIGALPTWVFSGARREGVLDFKSLRSLSGCR